jgi:hypothetical protein
MFWAGPIPCADGAGRGWIGPSDWVGTVYSVKGLRFEIIARFRLEPLAAALAVVEKLAGVSRNGLGGGVLAQRTDEKAVFFMRAIHCYPSLFATVVVLSAAATFFLITSFDHFIGCDQNRLRDQATSSWSRRRDGRLPSSKRSVSILQLWCILNACISR